MLKNLNLSTKIVLAKDLIERLIAREDINDPNFNIENLKLLNEIKNQIYNGNEEVINEILTSYKFVVDEINKTSEDTIND